MGLIKRELLSDEGSQSMGTMEPANNPVVKLKAEIIKELS